MNFINQDCFGIYLITRLQVKQTEKDFFFCAVCLCVCLGGGGGGGVINLSF